MLIGSYRNGWQSLQGMAATAAKRRYVLQVIELVPSFKMPTEAHESQPPLQEQEVGTASAASATSAKPVAPAQPVAQAQAPPSPQQQQQPAAAAGVTSQQRPPQVSTRPRQQQQLRQRLKQPVEASSYGAIFLQVLLFAALVGGFLFVSTRVALPLCLDLIVQHLGDESSRALVKSLTPVFWFALGYLFVAVIRSRVRLLSSNDYSLSNAELVTIDFLSLTVCIGQIFSWRLLSGEFVWLNLASPRARLRSGAASRQQQRRRRRRAGLRESEPPKSPTALLLEKFGIQLVEETSSDSSSLIVPRLELALAENPDAVRFGDSLTVFPFPLEQVRLHQCQLCSVAKYDTAYSLTDLTCVLVQCNRRRTCTTASSRSRSRTPRVRSYWRSPCWRSTSSRSSAQSFGVERFNSGEDFVRMRPSPFCLCGWTTDGLTGLCCVACLQEQRAVPDQAPVRVGRLCRIRRGLAHGHAQPRRFCMSSLTLRANGWLHGTHWDDYYCRSSTSTPRTRVSSRLAQSRTTPCIACRKTTRSGKLHYNRGLHCVDLVEREADCVAVCHFSGRSSRKARAFTSRTHRSASCAPRYELKRIEESERRPF